MSGNSPEYMRAYREANREHLREVNRVWREAHREELRAYERARYEANADSNRALARERHKRNAERQNARRREHYWRNVEANRERAREHGRQNRERRRAVEARRRARKLGNGIVELVDRRVVLERASGRCGICGGPVDPQDFHVDHITPVSLGGEESYTNTQPAHPLCNLRKGTRLLEAQMQLELAA